MRSHEERVAEVKRRITEKKRENQLQRGRLGMAAAVAACLALIVGVSLAMPGIDTQLRRGSHAGLEAAASMYGSSTAMGYLGYIVIGLLAFLLGVSVTVLCFRLRQTNQKSAQDPESGEQHGAD